MGFCSSETEFPKASGEGNMGEGSRVRSEGRFPFSPRGRGGGLNSTDESYRQRPGGGRDLRFETKWDFSSGHLMDPERSLVGGGIHRSHSRGFGSLAVDIPGQLALEVLEKTLYPSVYKKQIGQLRYLEGMGNS